jgi:PAS domain S-box-containing protein
MHFVGMLAFSLPTPVRYHVPTVLLSLLAAILASAVALYIASGERFGRRGVLVGSLVMGGGIAAMHYIGMAAMRLPATCLYNPLLLGLSIVIAVVASLAALTFAFNFQEEPRRMWAKMTSAAMMGVAIASMHYTGMASVSFVTSNLTVDFSHALNVSWLGIAGIVIVTLMALGFTLLTTLMDRRIAIQAVQLQLCELHGRQSRALIDAIPQQIWSSSANGSIDFCNERLRSYMGLGLEELQGDGWQSMVHPDDRERVAKAWHESVAHGTHFEQEKRQRAADGRYRWFLVRSVPLRDAGGHILRWYGTNTDIEDLKRAEEAVKQAEDRLRLVLDTTPALIHTGRPDGYLDYFNQPWLKYVGLPLEDLQGWAWIAVIHPEDVEEMVNSWRATLASGEPLVHEARVRRADGEYRWMLHSDVALRDEHGNIVKWYASSIDIEDRKRAEMQSLIDAIPQQIWSGPPDGNLDYCNDRWRSYMGLGLQELQGDGWQSMLHPDDRDRVLKTWHESVANGTLYEQEERHRAADGTYRWFLSRGVPLRDAEGRIVRWYGTNTDIEGRKQAEEELRHLSRQILRSQDEERRRIARDLHDSTGQDLVALATMLGQLRGSIPSGERKSHTLLSKCMALADQCIRDVRTLSYLLHPPVLDQAGLGDAIRDYVDGFIKRSGIQVELELSARLDRMARDVELALFRVVQEGLTNIQRHSGSQQAKIKIHHNSDVTLEISDLGRGVSASVQRGKEEPQFEVGVGILSMQERVKLVGGRFEIDSTGQGTTVRVTVPLGGNEHEKTSHSDR